MAYKPHPPAGPLLIGYDPESVLAPDHLCRFVDQVIGAVGEIPAENSPLGQSGYHPQMLAKVTLYAYATGVFSSRRIEQNCRENLAYIHLTRGQLPSYRVICTARIAYKEYFERVWLTSLATASAEGIAFTGKPAIDATRFKANVSGDLVLSADQYDEALKTFRGHLERAEAADLREDEEGQAVKVATGVDPTRITIRRVVRSIGKEAPEGELTPRLRNRLTECVDAVTQAKAEGRKHVSLSDPDARMMPVGSSRVVRMGYGLEVAADSGMIVYGQTTTAPSDSERLEPIVASVRAIDPIPLTQVTADSGYFNAEQIVKLQTEGLEVIVPDATTACQMRRSQLPVAESIAFEKIETRNAYRCPEGNVLVYIGRKRNSLRYRAVRECLGCPLADRCLKNSSAKRRTIHVRSHAERMKAYLACLLAPEMRVLYHLRGPSVETVFAFIRRILGFNKWSVRGAGKVSAEAELLKCAYQVRKLQARNYHAA